MDAFLLVKFVDVGLDRLDVVHTLPTYHHFNHHKTHCESLMEPSIGIEGIEPIV